MGRSIKNETDKAIKNRARVRKSRLLKRMRSEHETRIQAQIVSLEESSFEPRFEPCQEASSNERSMNESSEDDSNFFCDDVDKPIEIMNRLRLWAVSHRITQSAINELLAILIFGGFAFLPKDSRTFMRTPAKIDIVQVTNGKLWYHGIQKSIENVLCKITRDISITLDFSFDGLPVFKSSNVQFWPILSSIQGKLFQNTIFYVFFDLFLRKLIVLSYLFNRVPKYSSNDLWYLVWRK